ncbi:methyl-accepting chemotaxis protein [Erythrobacter mangrovi]|uniref:Methyl-accepting chemotaxis protein n=1 Tax=Erythrobacter mangrovi TaxID=2739433 RepID=A0A7D4B8K3_9SPHN|nr:methyl-accepting chemotaxis protein [Erythrobacter mangrovi]QKG71963.1 methyl-accepting chemotaxis protein [Erythrobacter mangrovi]
MRFSFASKSISGVLSIAGLIVGLGMVSILGLAWSTTSNLQKAVDESSQVTMAMRNHLESDKIHDALRTTTFRALQASLTSDPQEAIAAREDLDAYLAQLRKVQEATTELKLKPEIAAEMRSVQQSYVPYIEIVREIVALSGGKVEAVNQRMPKFQEVFMTMERENAKVTDLLEAEVHASAIRVSDTLSNLLLQLALGVVAVLTLTAVLVWQLRRRIVEPLARISYDLQSDLPTDLSEDQARVDEIGELARSVGAFREASERVRMSDEARIEAEHRAREEAERLKALANTAEALEQRTLGIVEQVIATTAELKLVADALADSAGQSHVETTSAAAAAEQTLGGVLAIAQATDELLVSIEEVSGRIHVVAQSGEEARQLATSTESTIAELNEMTKRITSFTYLIGEIAQRSNLLALNATIEAAHAGDAGSGFAVVAGEVKQLSNQTSKAVEEIEEQIRGMATITRNATSSLAAMAKAINELGGATTSIASAAEQQSLATSEIGRTIEMSSTGTEAMRGNLQRVEGQVSETASNAEAVREATRMLDAQASELSREMAAFIAQAKAA